MDDLEVFSLSRDKAIPFLRQDELDGNSTRFEHMVAAPEDEVLVKYWYSWVFIALACGFFSFFVCMSVTVDQKVRSKPFNLYLIYLMIPGTSEICFSIATPLLFPHQ